MAFVVKTVVQGDGNSYVDLSYADSYFSDRGIPAWAGTNEKKQGALIQATDYIDGRFGTRFTDEVNEALEIPDKLKKATAEYALRALTGKLAPDPKVDESGFSVVKTVKKLGPLETHFAVVGSAGSPANFRSYPAADMLLSGLLRPAANRVYR